MTTPADEAARRVRERLEARTPAERAADDAVLAVAAPVPQEHVVRLNPETAYSSKRGVGKAITFAKQAVIKLEGQVLADMVDQFNAVLAAERAERQQLEAEVAQLRAQVRALADEDPPR